MDIDKYLKRINFKKKIFIDNQSLINLHENHVMNVPFENLDVHYKKPFDLDINKIFSKVVDNYRGGFCYELNYLFNELLSNIGFNSRIIEARIYDDQAILGPRYDHMAILVETDKKYLLDVGFGDLFVQPLEIKDDIQIERSNKFKIDILNKYSFLLTQSSNQIDYFKKYEFYLNEVQIQDFENICLDKQMNPFSYFVKNTVCTKPTALGRLTVFNNKFIEKKGMNRREYLIENDEVLREILSSKFSINLD
jgi:N-hydroxyarylamine O-acetyltransferase